MSRNQNRIKGSNPETTQPQTQSQVSQVINNPVEPSPPQPASPFNFVVPTEMVDLPSKGQFYPQGHALHNCEAIEIKHMTAKEEDILTSATLIKKGVALDKMLQSIIVDKRIQVSDLLIGDKNALLIASRVFGYGSLYETEVQCPNCEATFVATFDLEELETKESLSLDSIARTENNTFVITLPKSNLEVEYKLMTSRDESSISSKKGSGTMTLFKIITVSVNGQTDRFFIEQALQSMPILDTSVLKKAYAASMPDILMRQEIGCDSCGADNEVEVPLNAGFFWPNI